MTKLIASIAIAFLVGVTLAGCAELLVARKQLDGTPVTAPVPLWDNMADKSGGE